jgi:hypothetical protein
MGRRREKRTLDLRKKKNKKMVTIMMTVNGSRERLIPMVRRKMNLKRTWRLLQLKSEQRTICLSNKCRQSGKKRRKSWIS